MRRDFVGFLRLSVPRAVQVKSQLEIHPETGGRPKEFGKPQCGAGGDTPLSLHNFVDELDRQFNPVCKLAL